MHYISDVIYMPTVRCNLNCRHCGENKQIKREEECSPNMVFDQIVSSSLLRLECINISGGEPFIKEDLIDFIIKIVRHTCIKIYITTNGYYYEKIEKLIGLLDKDEKERIWFSVSMDGLEASHNAIRENANSFSYGKRTIDFLKSQNVHVSVNTVMQEDNLKELEDLKAMFGCCHSFIPLAIDIGADKNMTYSLEYMKAVWPFLDNNRDRKCVLSQGTFRLRNCHAGEKNIVIAPDGKIYTCVTGAFYVENRDQFCLGSLKENSMDEILIQTMHSGIYYDTVKKCAGCSGPCEMIREYNLWKERKQFGLSSKEIKNLLVIENKSRMFGEAALDLVGWHDIEEDGAGEKFCWMVNHCSKVFMKYGGGDRIQITYLNCSINEIEVSIFVNGKHVRKGKCQYGINEEVYCIDPFNKKHDFLEIVFLTNRTWIPKEEIGSDDVRNLGIAIKKINYMDDHLKE